MLSCSQRFLNKRNSIINYEMLKQLCLTNIRFLSKGCGSKIWITDLIEKNSETILLGRSCVSCVQHPLLLESPSTSTKKSVFVLLEELMK